MAAVKRLLDRVKHHKKSNKLLKHKIIWQQEHANLVQERHACEYELNDIILRISNISDELEYQELPEMFRHVQNERKEDERAITDFAQSLSDPIRRLSIAKVTKVDKEAMKKTIEGMRKTLQDQGTSLAEQEQALMKELSQYGSAWQEDLLLPAPDMEDSVKGLENMLYSADLADLSDEARDEAEAIVCKFAENLKRLEEMECEEQSEIRQEFAEICAHKFGTTSDSPSGSWPMRDHLMFKYLRKLYMKKAKAKKEELVERLRMEFRSRNAADFDQHFDWCAQEKFFRIKMKDMEAMWSREKKKLLNTARSSIVLLADTVREETRRAVETRQLAEERGRLHSELSELRQKKEASLAEQAAQQKLIEEEQRREQELRDKEIEEYRKQSQVAVARYRKMLDEQASKQRELAAIRAREEEEEKRKQLKVGQVRTRYRADLREQQIQDRRQRQEAMVLEAQARAAKLEALRNSVAPVVDACPERVLQPTESSQQEDSSSKPLFRTDGYTDDTLFKDERFKLNMALSKAGLAGTDYGRKVIASAPTSTVYRRDMKHTDLASR